MQEFRARVHIVHAIAAQVAEQFAGVSVKQHPHGGWTHAEPSSPGSSSKIYHGNFPSEGAANAALLRRKREATAELMRGQPKGAPAAQMTLLPE